MLRDREQVVHSWLQHRQAEVSKLIFRSVLFGCGQYFFIALQAASLAWIINGLVMAGSTLVEIAPGIIILLVAAVGRGLCGRFREMAGQWAGQMVCRGVRAELLAKIEQQGPVVLAQRSTGSWLTLLMEQVDKLHNYYAYYAPQLLLVRILPVATIVLALSLSWLIALVLLITAPLLVFFMVLVGNRAAAVSQKNIQALSRLSGHFLDRLQGLTTLKLFFQTEREQDSIEQAAEDFRSHTMRVLRLAFLSSSVLEFFTSVSIAITAVYLGLSYLGYLDFGLWESPLTLSTGLFLLLLAPEYYHPIRELGTHYHAKADAVAAADDLEAFLQDDSLNRPEGTRFAVTKPAASIVFNNVSVVTKSGRRILDNISFSLGEGEHLVIVGESGAGKTTLMNVLLGFVDYEGEVLINGLSLKELNLPSWRQQLAWLGQNPRLFHGSLRDNIVLAAHGIDDDKLQQVMASARVDEFLERLPDGVHTQLGDEGAGLSVGQAQRVALARALIRPFQLLLLDEPTASLDHTSAMTIRDAVAEIAAERTMVTITHRSDSLTPKAKILVLDKGKQVGLGSPKKLRKSCAMFRTLTQQWQTLETLQTGGASHG